MKRYAAEAAIILAASVLLAACGSPTLSNQASTSHPSIATASGPHVLPSPSARASSTALCAPPAGPSQTTHYAFDAVTIPAGADACQNVGAYGNPEPLHLSNDGPLVAFNARDLNHEEYLWLGDLRAGPIDVVYTAPKTTGKKAEIWWPQLASGQLFWIEYIHTGPNVNTSVSTWSVKRMDVSTRVVSTVAQDRAPELGGKKYVDKIQWDGHTLAAGVSLPNLTWQIELWDLRGNVSATIPVSGTLYDFALTTSGVMFTSGLPFPSSDSIGHMKTYLWTTKTAPVQIGTGAFNVAASADLAAWISDPDASRDSTGFPVTQRVYVARTPFTVSTPESPKVTSEGTSGVDTVALGSGTVMWLEVEGPRGTGRDVLTAWQPGWRAPVQIKTEGMAADLSVRNGWVVWFEYDNDMNGRLRGAPLSILPDWHG